MKHFIDVDYNRRDPSGECLRRTVPVGWGIEIGDEVVCYEPAEGTELDAVVTFIGPPRRLDNGRQRQSVWMKPLQWQVRDMHRCDTPCDSDCDAYCHEGHLVPWKRSPGHPYPRIVNGIES